MDENINLGNAIDPNGDSLSYEKTPLLIASGTPLQYFGPYSDAIPFPYFGAPQNPQKGIALNPLTGELIFRPMGNFSANMGIRVNKWRMVNGSYQVIGFVTREINIQSFFCANNNPPQIFTYDENNLLTIPQPSANYILKSDQEFCITFTARDNHSSSDTTHLTIIGKQTLEKFGAKFTPLYNPNTRGINGPKYDSIQLCWVPPNSAIQIEPYVLKINAADQACPSPAKSSFNIHLLVTKPLGLNQNTEAESFLKTYPNPATDILKVELINSISEDLNLQLFSLNGRLVQTEKIAANQLQTSLKLDQLTKGIYTLKVTGNELNLNKKIILF
jgi:hypothetical protein